MLLVPNDKRNGSLPVRVTCGVALFFSSLRGTYCVQMRLLAARPSRVSRPRRGFRRSSSQTGRYPFGGSNVTRALAGTFDSRTTPREGSGAVRGATSRLLCGPSVVVPSWPKKLPCCGPQRAGLSGVPALMYFELCAEAPRQAGWLRVGCAVGAVWVLGAAALGNVAVVRRGALAPPLTVTARCLRCQCGTSGLTSNRRCHFCCGLYWRLGFCHGFGFWRRGAHRLRRRFSRDRLGGYGGCCTL